MSMLLKLFICITFSFPSIFAAEIDDWKVNLANSLKLNDEINFFISTGTDHIPPNILILHTWTASPFLEKNARVGHMSLQIQDLYISIWPADESEHPKPTSSTIEEDFKKLGNSQFLVIEVSDDDWDIIYENAETLYYDVLQNNVDDYTFNIGSISLSIPLGKDKSDNFTIESRLSGSTGPLSIEKDKLKSCSTLKQINKFMKRCRKGCKTGLIAGGVTGGIAGAGIIGSIVAATEIGATAGAAVGSIVPGAGNFAGLVGGSILGFTGAVTLSAAGLATGFYSAKAVEEYKSIEVYFPEKDSRPIQIKYNLSEYEDEINTANSTKKCICCKTAIFNILKKTSLAKFIDDIISSEAKFSFNAELSCSVSNLTKIKDIHKV